MNKKQFAVAALLVCVLLFAAYKLLYPKNYVSVMAVTGATPLALTGEVQRGTTLEVLGMTKRVYSFNKNALDAFAATYIRTREVAPDGKFLGTYRYTGIPVLHILEGIAPKKPESAAFERPLDMLVTFVGENGATANFSYGELTMTDDSNPVILAFDRKELTPTEAKKKEAYTANVYHENVKGLRLVCPAEPDTVRYLDDVKKIVLTTPDVPYKELPAATKGAKCSSDTVVCLWGGKKAEIKFAGVARDSIKNWVRTGHGQGFKGIADAKGYNLVSALEKNFPGCGPDNYFLFVACDGYRALFSGRELFLTDDGRRAMIITELNGKTPSGGMTLGPVRDYYVDRDVWGLAYIAVLDAVSPAGQDK